MNILALETSTEFCSVALWRDGEIDWAEEHVGQSHSGRLLAMATGLLARHSLDVMQLAGIAFGAGPGSFTGLRIACGVTQGLAFAAGIPVVGVGTLVAMAESTSAQRVVCCIDARMREVYHAAYVRAEEGWRAVHEPGVYAPADVPLVSGEAWLACGNGFREYRDVLLQRYEGHLADIAPEVHARAREIVRLAVPRFEGGETQDAARAAPLYVRDKVALKTHEQK